VSTHTDAPRDDLRRSALVDQTRHLLDLFELLYHWHDGDGELRIVKTDVDGEYAAGCSDSLIATYARLRGHYLRDVDADNPASFLSTGFALAQLCVVELDPADGRQCAAIGELLLPNFSHAPRESIGRRWLEDAAATAWRIAVPISADRQRL
jgi:hypothetical protein